MSDASYLPRYVPAQREAAAAAAERRARMTPAPPPRLPSTTPTTEPPPARLHLRPGARDEPPKIYEVQRVVCDYLGVTLESLTGGSHLRGDVRPRHIAMLLCNEVTGRSMNEIGRRFGGRDHATVQHAYKVVRDLVEKDPIYARVVRELRSMLT